MTDTETQPVAWMYEHPEHTTILRLFCLGLAGPCGWTETPLYAHPPTDTLARLQRERDQAVEALRRVEDAWVKNNSEGDDYDEGYDDALKAGHDIARATLAAIEGAEQ